VGRFILDGIPPAPRGVPQVEVTFDIDANGILNVSAKDKGTGKQQNVRIEASTGLSKEEIERMKNEASMNADADKNARERADKINEADSVIFQTEKQLKEIGDKIPADKKQQIESNLAALKTAHQSQDLEQIKTHLEALNAAWMAASQDIYQATQGDENAAQNGSNGENAHQTNTGSEGVTDVEFEEVNKN